MPAGMAYKVAAVKKLQVFRVTACLNMITFAWRSGRTLRGTCRDIRNPEPKQKSGRGPLETE